MRNRSFLFYIIGKRNLTKGFFRLKLDTDFLKHFHEMIDRNVFPILMEHLNESAHVGSLKMMGKIHKKIHSGSSILNLMLLIQNRYRVFHIAHPDLLKRNLSIVFRILYVYHNNSQFTIYNSQFIIHNL